ncbi:MAG: hypothetical protein AAF438_16730 [Pseudomonadota bacterium]
MPPRKVRLWACTAVLVSVGLQSSYGQESWSGGLDQPFSDFHTPVSTHALEDHMVVEECYRELRKHPGEQRVYAAVRKCTEYSVSAISPRSTPLVKHKYASAKPIPHVSVDEDEPTVMNAPSLWLLVVILSVGSGFFLHLFPTMNVLDR